MPTDETTDNNNNNNVVDFTKQQKSRKTPSSPTNSPDKESVYRYVIGQYPVDDGNILIVHEPASGVVDKINGEWKERQKIITSVINAFVDEVKEEDMGGLKEELDKIIEEDSLDVIQNLAKTYDIKSMSSTQATLVAHMLSQLIQDMINYEINARKDEKSVQTELTDT